MLDRSHRFSFKRGAPRQIYKTPLFVVRFAPNGDQLHFAVVVGKKVDKRAVIRNRIKRQLTATITELLGKDLQYDIVLFVKKQIIEVDNDTIIEQLEKTLTEIYIIP